MSIRKIPVIKGGPSAFVEIDTETLPEQYYVAALDSGLKTLVNGGATKILKPTDTTDETKMAEFHRDAVEKAKDRVAAMLAGTLKLGRSAAVKGPSGAVSNEARRIARQLIKDTLKAQGFKVSHYSASTITGLANDLLASENGPGLIKQAEENLAARSKTTISIDVTSIKEDPTLVAKAEQAALAKKAGSLSKTQAGKVAPRASKAVH